MHTDPSVSETQSRNFDHNIQRDEDLMKPTVSSSRIVENPISPHEYDPYRISGTDSRPRSQNRNSELNSVLNSESITNRMKMMRDQIDQQNIISFDNLNLNRYDGNTTNGQTPREDYDPNKKYTIQLKEDIGMKDKKKNPHDDLKFVERQDTGRSDPSHTSSCAQFQQISSINNSKNT